MSRLDIKANDKRMEKGEMTKGRIIHAAIAIIAEGGIKEVSAAKLAAAVGVSKSNIFHHFKSIDEVVSGVLDIIFSEFLEPMNMERRNLEEYLNAMGQSVLNVPEEYQKVIRAFFSFYHEGMFNPTYQKLLADSSRSTIHMISSQLKQLASKSVSEETLEAASKLLLSTLDGMGLHSILNGETKSFQKAWQLQTAMLLRELT